jgi:WhiB family transcriptional regulator, redox-sensing transcriptional regulator
VANDPGSPGRPAHPRGVPGEAAWQEQALCRGQGTSLFIRGPKADYGRLRAVCGACPVRQECLDLALADDSLIGLWGGMSDAERREIRRRVA